MSGFHRLKDEALRGLHPAIEEQRPDQCLDHVADDILAFGRTVLAGLLAEPDQRGDADLAPILGAGVAVDQTIVALGEIAFRFAWVASIQRSGDDQAEHAVAEEFEPLIALARRRSNG